MSQKVNNPDNTIAFQGIPGAYSEMACLSNFNTMETLACPSFEQMISSVQDNKAKLAMVPVENSTAGLSLIHISEPRDQRGCRMPSSA